MITDPREAWATYQDAQKKLEEQYEEFWRQAFLSVGLVFQKKDYQNVLMIKNWEIAFYVYPRQFEGVRVTFQNLNNHSWDQWRKVKIMSKSGMQKFLRTLHSLTQ